MSNLKLEIQTPKPGNIYWQMFTTFVRIGTFTIGGGYAMIPLIQKEVVERKKWMDAREFIDMLAMAQSAPGVIAINTAIFIGYKIKGFKGSLVTTLGSALPSFIIILLIAMTFTNFKDNIVVEKIFKGIRPAVVALIAAPLYNMSKSAGITWKTIIIPVLTALLIWLAGVSPIWIVAIAIAGGIFYGSFHSRRITKSRNQSTKF
ncbi:MAG: chromate transporter [Paludibacteraceae bacterium]